MSVRKSLQVNKTKGEVIELPPTKIDLHNANAIRRELASVYRDMRSQKIEPAVGTKLAYVLDALRKSYETAVLEDQLKQIELRMRLEKNHEKK